MLNFLLTILSVLTTALKRLRANLGLALCALVALLAAVALSVSIPVYAEAANLRLLQDRIAKQEQQTNRSPFALLFRYIGSQKGPLEWERIKAADDYICGRAVPRLGLPSRAWAAHVRTDQLQLLLPPSSGAQNPLLKSIPIGFLSGMDQQIRIVDGTAPKVATALPDGASGAAPVEVMILRDLADEVGINVGDQFNLVANAGGKVVSIPIRIAALWAPTNSADPAWFYQPSVFKEVLLVPEATFTGPIAAAAEE